MSNQIENLSLSFNEILLNIGTLFDDLYSDKTTNLVLPSNSKSAENLNTSIKTFDKNLDDILIQLGDISLFDTKLKQQKLEREQQKLNTNNTNDEKKDIKEDPQEQSQQQQQDQQDQLQQIPEDSNDFGNGNDENILDDINMFLSTVPDSADTNLNGEFNDNIQDLLMENDPYGSNNQNDNYDMNFDFQNTDNDNGNNNNMNNDNNNNGNNNNNNEGNNGNESNMDFDNNIFDEIDSMLNI